MASLYQNEWFMRNLAMIKPLATLLTAVVLSGRAAYDKTDPWPGVDWQQAMNLLYLDNFKKHL